MNPLPGRTHRAKVGHTANITVKTVCGHCNTGWMSRLDEAVKAFAEPMLEGSIAVLTGPQRQLLTEWIVMKLFVFESAKNVRRLSEFADMEAFYKDRTIPPGTQIHLFRHADPPWIAQAIRHSTGFLKDGETDVGQRNNQTLTVGLGAMLVHVLQSYTGMTARFDPQASVRLWPSDGTNLTWPPHGVLAPGVPDRIASSLMDHILNTTGSPDKRVHMS